MWRWGRSKHVWIGRGWFQKIGKLKGRHRLSLRGIWRGKVIFIKLSMSSDIYSRCRRVKTTEPFIRSVVAHKNARNTSRGKFIWHIIT
jgi:hypothetical protein